MQLNQVSDLELIQEILSGNNDLFEQLMERYEGTVYQIALDLTGREQEASVVVEDVFVKIFRDLEKFNGEQFLELIHQYTYDEALSKLVTRIEGHLDESDQISRSVMVGSVEEPETEIVIYNQALEEIDSTLEEARSKLDCAMQLITLAARHYGAPNRDADSDE